MSLRDPTLNNTSWVNLTITNQGSNSMSSSEYITSISGADYEQCFLKIKPEAEAVVLESRTNINLDIPDVLLTAIGVIPRLSPFIEVVQKLPEYEYQEFMALRERTMALHYIQAKYTHTLAPQEKLPALLVEATRRRDVFLADCAALIARGIIRKEAITEYKGLNGYKNVAFDLTGVIQLFVDIWPQIKDKTMVSRTELEEHRKFALEFVEAVALREKFTARTAEVTEMRQRVFALFNRSYDQVRRAIIFLRWNQEDADTIIPSLYANRGGNTRKQVGTEEATSEKPETPTEPPATSSTVASETKLPAGHPNSMPFAS